MKKNFGIGVCVALFALVASGAHAAMLDAQPCSIVNGFKSPAGVANQLLTVNNNASESIAVSWIGLNGQETAGTVVQASKTAFMKGAAGWGMVVRDFRGQCIGVYIMEAGGNGFVIRDSMLPGRSAQSAPRPSPAASAAPTAPARALADNEFRMPDGSVWAFEGKYFQRREPAPVLSVGIRMYKVDIPCARGRPLTGYPQRPAYMPAPFVGATAETTSNGTTVQTVCADVPGGAVEITPTWRQPLSTQDQTSLRHALTFMLQTVSAIPDAGTSKLALFSPPRGTVGMLQTTGVWNYIVEENHASETILLEEWPAEPSLGVRLAYSPGEQRCDQTGIEGSEMPKPDWVPATFYPRALVRDGQIVVCADVRGHALMVQTVERGPVSAADHARLGALLLMLSGAL